jgi:hypothetical protein
MFNFLILILNAPLESVTLKSVDFQITLWILKSTFMILLKVYKTF